MKFPENFMCSH